MQRAFVVKGRITGSRTVELAEPLPAGDFEVEVIVREVARPAAPPPDDTESPVAILRRDVVDAALARKPPKLEVVFERSEQGDQAGDPMGETGLIVARRKASTPPDDGEDDTDPNIRRPDL